MEDYQSWLQILKTVNNSTYLEALQQGFPFLQSVAEKGYLPEPYIDHTRNFCRTVLKEIIIKLFEIVPSYQNYDENQILNFFYVGVIIISLQKVTTIESDFTLLINLFSYSDEYAQDNQEFIRYLITLFMSKTNNFHIILHEFTTESFPSFEEYSTFYLILGKLSPHYENLLQQSYAAITPYFHGFLSVQTPESISVVRLDILVSFANMFLSAIQPLFTNGEELFPFYNFLRVCLACTILEKKLFAAHYFVNSFEAINDEAKTTFCNYLIAINFFDDFLRTKPHVELVSIFSPLICKMAEFELISIETILLIWQLSITATSTDRLVYFKLIINLLPYQADDFLGYFFQSSLDTISDSSIILQFYKLMVTELTSKGDKLREYAISQISNRCDNPQWKKAFIEFIQSDNEEIIQVIKVYVDQWIENKLYHVNAYEIINALLSHRTIQLSFDSRTFIDYIIVGLQYDRANNRTLFNLFSLWINKNDQVVLDTQELCQIYTNSDKKYFWEFALSLLKQKNLSFCQNHGEFIHYAISNEDASNVTKEYVDFVLLYYILFSTIEDKSIIEQGHNSYQLLHPNDSLTYLFYLCGMAKNTLCAETIKKFLTSLLLSSKMPLSKTVSYIIEQILVFQNQNANKQSAQVYQLLLAFIDDVEAKFDLSIFNKRRIKDSKKLLTISVNSPNSCNKREIRITPKTSIQTLANIVSALFRVPVDLVSINAESFKNAINNSIANITKDVQIDYLNNLNAHDIFDSKTFPVFCLSTIENTHYFITLLQNPILAPVSYKLLSRFIFIQTEFDHPEFYISKFREQNSPFYFKYMVIRLQYILKFSPELIPKDALNVLLNLLYDTIVGRRFESKFIVPALRLLAEFYQEDLFKVNVALIIDQAIPNPRYLMDYMKAALALLPKGDGFVLNPDILIHLTKLSTDDQIFQIFDKILSRVTSESSLMAFLLSIINNPILYTHSNYIERIFEKVLKKIPAAVPQITRETVNSFQGRTPASIPVLCKILNITLYPDFHNQIDLKPLIRDLMARHAFTTNDENVQTAIFNLANKVQDDTYDDLIRPLLHVPVYNFETHNFHKQIHSMSGLQNLGCTCYMNSVLQQLAAIDNVLLTLSVASIDPDIEIRPDINQLFFLFAQMKFGIEETCTTRDYCDLYKNYNTEFSAGQQEDANEYFIMILDAFPDTTKELFQGKFKETIRQADNQRILNEHEEIYTTVSVPVANITDLASALRQFLAPEPLTGDNSYSIGDGQKVDALKETSFLTIPHFLVFQLKRFEYNFTNFTRYKIDSRFEFPTTINMSEFSNIDSLYRLKGAVIHMGVAEGGHYISVVKHQSKWIKCDDCTLTEISDDAFFDLAFGGSGCCNAYLLFYECDGEDNPISDNALLQMMPEEMRNRITEYNNSITRCCSLCTNASMDYFLKRLPSDISLTYFFKVLCHLRDRNKIKNFATHIENASAYIVHSATTILELLENIIDPDGTQILVDLLSDSLNAQTIRAFWDSFEYILSKFVLINKLGMVFESAARKGKLNEESFTILRDEVIPAVLNNTKVNITIIHMSVYFVSLVYAPPTFDFGPLLVLLPKLIDIGETPLFSFLYALATHHFDFDSLVIPVSQKWTSCLSATKLLSSNSPDEIRQSIEDANDDMLNCLINLSREEFLSGCLQRNPDIILTFLLRQEDQLRLFAVKVVISLYGTTNNSSDPTYDNSKANNNESSQKFFNKLIDQLIPIASNEERQSILRNEDINPNTLIEYFNTMSWFCAGGIICTLSDESIIALNKIVSIQREIRMNGNILLLFIAVFIVYSKNHAVNYLIPYALEKYVVNEQTDQQAIENLCLALLQYRLILNYMNKTDREIVLDIINSDQFIRMIRFIMDIPNYKNNDVLKSFTIFVKQLVKNIQNSSQSLGEMLDSEEV